MRQNEISRETRLKEKLDKEMKQLHIDMEAKTADVKSLNLQAQKTKEEQQRVEQQLKELKVKHGAELESSSVTSMIIKYINLLLIFYLTTNYFKDTDNIDISFMRATPRQVV